MADEAEQRMREQHYERLRREDEARREAERQAERERLRREVEQANKKFR